MSGGGDLTGPVNEASRRPWWGLLVLLVTTALMVFLAHYPFRTSLAGSTPLALGFLMLTGWCSGLLAARVGLPMLTGYILAGIAAGPHVSGLITEPQVADLRLVDELALTFIALVAGGELHFGPIRERWRSIASWIGGQILVTPLVVIGGVFIAARWIPATGGSLTGALALGLVLGAVSLARSPAATVVVIEESGARGPFTETSLATTVTLDTIVILLFALAVAVAEKLLSPAGAFDAAVLVGLSTDLVLSLLIGAAVAALVTILIHFMELDLPVLLAGIAFLITRGSAELSRYLAASHDIHVHLEPLLMGLTAGILVQNLSRRGHTFTEGLERVGPPIYVAFFSLTGAALDVSALATTWSLALLLVVLRFLGLYLGSWTGALLGRDPPRWRRLCGLTSIAQAGVSLGLAAELGRRFPEWGVTIVAPLIAAIAINQVLGPILLAHALRGAGEVSDRTISDEEGDAL